ncbi:LysR family transcriptional regulator [Kocuria flava]|uniref:LysR family transcriptional regulator n=1 Tax=Kocuria flava TaxID=446860 RepID=UPI001FF37F3C|nr:LysR family transcriptional regulator [Kocuria flava]MCJ8503974.1 LysR family transcriptional regulator [Kocuria flava]
MKEITFRQLQYLVAVADHGSMAAAAKACHVSSVAIGQALDDLERFVGARLTTRIRSKGVTLTRTGQLLSDRAHAIVQEVRNLEYVVEEAEERMRGTLRLGTFPTLSSWAVPAVVEEFTTRHPEVNLELVEGDGATLSRGLADGSLDMFLGFRTHVGAEANVIHIRDVRPRVLIAAEHPLGQRESVHLSELRDEPIALLSVYPVFDLLSGVLAKHGLADNIRWRGSNVDVIKNLVGRGLAWTMLVSLGAPATSAEGRPLRNLAIEDELASNAIVACIPAGVPTGPAHQVVINLMRELPFPGALGDPK